MTQIYEEGLIDKFQFSIVLSPKENYTSQMTIGDYDRNGYNANKVKLVAHPVSGSFHWTVHILKYRIGNGEWKLNMYPKSLTDTGATWIYIPKCKNLLSSPLIEEYDNFIKEFHSTHVPKYINITKYQN